jgi:hypothetical protein
MAGGYRPLRGLSNILLYDPGAYAPGFMLSPAPQAEELMLTSAPRTHAAYPHPNPLPMGEGDKNFLTLSIEVDADVIPHPNPLPMGEGNTRSLPLPVPTVHLLSMATIAVIFIA